MAQAKMGDRLLVEWDETQSRTEGVEVERGPFEGKVVAQEGRQVVVEFWYRGEREPERVTLDLHRRRDLTNNVALVGVKILNRHERRARQHANRELFQALEAVHDINAILVVDEIIRRHKLDVCPCCLARPVFERNPDGSPVEDRGQRVMLRDDDARTCCFWICEMCAVSYAHIRSRTTAVPFNYDLWTNREVIEARRQELGRELRQRFGGAPTRRGG